MNDTQPQPLTAAGLLREIESWRSNDNAGIEAAVPIFDQIESYLRSMANGDAAFQEFKELKLRRDEGDESITDEILAAKMAESLSVPGVQVSVRFRDPDPEPEYSVDNPSPEFMALRNDVRATDINTPDVVILNDSNNEDQPHFFAAGPKFINLQESDDYAFGSSIEEALQGYTAVVTKRNRENAIRQFIEADKMKETAIEIYRNYDQAIDTLLRVMEIGDHFQDDEGTVYQLATQEWVKVKVKPAVVNRTRREGERAGDLSLKAARELGYTVEGEDKDSKPKKKVKTALKDEPEFADDPNHANPDSPAGREKEKAMIEQIKESGI